MAVVVAVLCVWLCMMYRALRHSRDQLQAVRQQIQEARQQSDVADQRAAGLSQSARLQNRVRDQLITRHMKQSRAVIAQLQGYQQTLQRLAATRSTDRLFETIRNSEGFDAELDAFYANFDDTFLTLYPDFVAQLNAMIPPADRYPLSREANASGVPVATNTSRGALSTELRVFALMHLGVTDLDEIAAFLRCAPKTVLNYRSRLRQRATVGKEELDRFLMNNGQFTIDN